LTVVILVAEVVCAEDDYELKAKLLSTTILLSGITTLIQVTFGIRLVHFINGPGSGEPRRGP
jgi:xanthine/uracil permease